MSKRAGAPAVVLLLCLTVLLPMLLGHGWQRVGIHGGIGPLGLEACEGWDTCTSYLWSDVAMSSSIEILGLLTLIFGVVAFGFALVCAGFGLAGRLGDVPHRSARVLLAIAIAVATTWQILVSTSSAVAKLTYLELTSVGYGGVFAIAAMCVAWVCVHRIAVHERRQRNLRVPVVAQLANVQPRPPAEPVFPQYPPVRTPPEQQWRYPS